MTISRKELHDETVKVAEHERHHFDAELRTLRYYYRSVIFLLLVACIELGFLIARVG